MAEVDWYIFDEAHERFSSLIDDLDTIRDLIAPNGEEDWFDDEGMWSEKGVASLATYVQALQMYQNTLDSTSAKIKDYSKPFAGNEKYYKNLGIDSEQDLYDAREKLIDQQYDYQKAISDSEQSVVDMYESQIDAIEEYTSNLVDSYNDYIDVVKEALDAERDLYEFKKNVQKQTKDIATLERRIAALSGSDNAADIAERRRLEADLYEAKEGLDDTYYGHAKDAQQQALDNEAASYEESMNNYIEKLRTTLEEAIVNMDVFMQSVSASVLANAQIVKDQYISTGVELDNAIVTPWNKAIEATKQYETDGLSLMNAWTAEEGFFDNFNKNATAYLESPWKAGAEAAGSFKSSIDTVMSGILSSVKSNVTNVTTELNKIKSAYAEIQDTTVTPPSTPPSGNGNGNGNINGNGLAQTLPNTQAISLQTALNTIFNAKLDVDGKIGSKTKAAIRAAQDTMKAAYIPTPTNGKYDSETKAAMLRYADWRISKMRSLGGSSAIGQGIEQLTYAKQMLPPASFYAKGTLGTNKSGLAYTDEPWLGDELTMYATKQGTLSYMRAGSTVVPADLTKELVSIGELGLDGLMKPKLDSGISFASNVINKPELNISFDSLVKAEKITEETLPAVKKLVTQELDRFTKQLNYALKGVGGR